MVKSNKMSLGPQIALFTMIVGVSLGSDRNNRSKNQAAVILMCKIHWVYIPLKGVAAFPSSSLFL